MKIETFHQAKKPHHCFLTYIVRLILLAYKYFAKFAKKRQIKCKQYCNKQKRKQEQKQKKKYGCVLSGPRRKMMSTAIDPHLAVLCISKVGQHLRTTVQGSDLSAQPGLKLPSGNPSNSSYVHSHI